MTKKQVEPTTFNGSGDYWEHRYASGRNSGVGSYKKFADFKAGIINPFVETNNIQTVIEFGCGDGNQLSLSNYHTYTGFDVSKTAIDFCKRKYVDDASKIFKLANQYNSETADLSLSLDVLYHLVEDNIFSEYMKNLFNASKCYVVIYSSNFDSDPSEWAEHVRHRNFTQWIDKNIPNWTLVERIENEYPYTGNYKTGTPADFYIYKSNSKFNHFQLLFKSLLNKLK